MSRWLPPDKACIGVDLPQRGRSYTQRNRDGAFEAHSGDERLLRAAGCFPAALSPLRTRTGGCSACGHRVFNRIENRRLCAACGKEN